MAAEELLFDSTAGFGRYKPFLEQSIAHPAKMNTRLLEFLVKAHTKEGDVVLDPMAGSGSTGIISALYGRNAINVELEEKFYGWMEEARRKVESSTTLSSKGKIVNIKGDARQLSKLLEEADVVLTSPPYSESLANENPNRKKGYWKTSGGYQSGHGIEIYGEKRENIGNLSHGDIDAVITSPPYSESISKHAGGKCTLEKVGISTKTARSYTEEVDVVVTSPPYSSGGWKADEDPANPIRREAERKKLYPMRPPDAGRYSENPSNIGNLPHGEVDAVITSPPYAERSEHKLGYDYEKRDLERGHQPYKGFREQYSENPDNIAHLKHGEVDAVITSPPYADSKKGDEDEERMASNLEKHGLSEETRRNRHTPGRLRAMKSMVSGYSKTEENIGNLGFVDSVITSPPYAHDSVVHKNRSGETQVAKDKFGYSDFYSPSSENIGNLQKETYLEAMLKVYNEMWKVLKPEGSAIIVIKPFIRNKKVVDLPWHTWLLLEKVGFKLTKLYKLHLKQDSFWRILYKKKYPSVPEIKHEYIIVCQKSPSFCV